jgi:hypothetical protein
VAKYPPRADKQASCSTGSKASTNIAMVAKHPLGIPPASKHPPVKKQTRPLRQSIRSTEGPSHSRQQLPERKPTTAVEKYPPENPMTAKYPPREEAIAAKHPLLEQNNDKPATDARTDHCE